MTLNTQGYSLSNERYGLTAILNGPWEDRMRHEFTKYQVKGLWVNYARGFVGDNLDFLSYLPDLENLLVISYWINDLSPVNQLKRLRSLSIGNGKYRGVNFHELPVLEDLSVDRIFNMPSLAGCDSLVELEMGSYRDNDLSKLCRLSRLRRLKLRTSPITSLDGVQFFKKIEKLCLYGLTKLSDISAVSQCTGLRVFEVETCRKLTDLDALHGQVTLERLGIGNFGDIESLSPTSSLINIVDFIFDGDTNIVDGNLEPLLGLPKLEFTMFKDRKHYNHAAKEFPRSGGPRIALGLSLPLVPRYFEQQRL